MTVENVETKYRNFLASLLNPLYEFHSSDDHIPYPIVTGKIS